MDGVMFFLFKKKTAYEMRISDWSSDVCSSDLCGEAMGRWQREALTEGLMARRRCPSTTRFASGPPPHRFATGRIGNVRSPSQNGPCERTEERRGGKERVSTCRFRVVPYH